MTSFEEGYKFFAKRAGIQFAGYEAEAYVNSVKSEINELVSDLNAFKGFQTDPSKLKGDIAEFWHSDTFNINAVIRDSTNRTFVDRSHDFASADIDSNFGIQFGLKYYQNGTKSAKQQSKSVFERFCEYRSKGGKDALEKFLQDRGFIDDTVLNDPIYAGQVRIIPKEQLEEACQWLQKKIATESVNRPEQVIRYQETLKMLSEKIEDGTGTESVILSDDAAKKLAILAKKGQVTVEKLAEFGVSTEELIRFEHIARQAFKSGLSAATIAVVLKVAPEIYHSIEYLIKTGELSSEQFKQIGFAALDGSCEGFIRGTISVAITASCEAGLLGNALKNIAPELVSMAVVLTMNTMKNSFLVATGKMDRTELTNQLIKELFISASSYTVGVITQTFSVVPVLGFMVGSFIGSIVGAFTYNVGYNAVLSFCMETGFTMFGLVSQSYTLPDEIIKEIGIETFGYEHFECESFEPDSFEADSFSVDSFDFDTLDISFLRRGVIGVSKIGYVS